MASAAQERRPPFFDELLGNQFVVRLLRKKKGRLTQGRRILTELSMGLQTRPGSLRRHLLYAIGH